MKIIIVGCGKVGAALTKSLSTEDNNVCIIDRNPEIVRELASQYDVMGLVGNGASYSTLVEADIENTDLLIAVTESDELNLLCCVIARKKVDCHTIARVRDPMYSNESQFLQKELGLSMIINPELTAAVEISHLLCFPGATGIDSFAGGKVEMLRLRIPQGSPLHEMSLIDLSAHMRSEFLVCAVNRDGEVRIPDGHFVLRSGDEISIMASRRDASQFFRKIGLRTAGVRNTMIIGGGKISLYLARILLNLGIEVKIIERDPQLCQELCEQIPKADIICGDAGSESLLQEERIDKMDSFVALTNLDEENILLSLLAKKKVSRKVVTKINRLQLNEVIRGMDLDSAIYPKLLTAQTILQYVRATQNSIGSNVKTLYRLYDDKVEALEFNVAENAPITGVPLMDLHLKKGLLICAINRGGRVLIPNGQAQILAGDTIIVVTTRLGLKDAREILDE